MPYTTPRRRPQLGDLAQTSAVGPVTNTFHEDATKAMSFPSDDHLG